MNAPYSHAGAGALHALQAAGLMVDDLETGRLIRCRVQEGKRGNRDGWYLAFDDGGIVYGDWHHPDQIGKWQPEGAQPINRAAIEKAKALRKAEQVKERAANGQRLITTWQAAAPATAGGLIDRYLRGRGLHLPNGSALRGARLTYWEDGQPVGDFPTMVAAVTSQAGGLVTLHRTYLSNDHRKAGLPQPKKLMPAAAHMGGAAIRLMQHGQRLGIAEGIETAISASRLFGVPTWAAVSAHGLAAWRPPKTVEQVDIFADNDTSETGQQAAAKLAQALILDGLEVRIHTPQIVGDWNDVLTGGGHA